MKTPSVFRLIKTILFGLVSVVRAQNLPPDTSKLPGPQLAGPAVSLSASGHRTKPYNMAWNTPGTKGYDSMPAGAGNVQ